MPTTKSDTTPYWSTSTTFPQFAKLADDAEADVAVVGGGITGLTAAYLLAKAGTRVIVLARGRCAGTDTGHTSAHVTMVTDTRLSDLIHPRCRGSQRFPNSMSGLMFEWRIGLVCTFSALTLPARWRSWQRGQSSICPITLPP